MVQVNIKKTNNGQQNTTQETNDKNVDIKFNAHDTFLE